MTLERCAPDDLPFVFWCRNDPLTRAMSRRTHFIEWDEIKTWDVLIAVEVGRVVGYGRIEPQGDWADISYVIAPNCRGRGHGAELVRSLIARCHGHATAVIKSLNIASIATARHAGMAKVSDADDLQTWTA